jgi:hypothetical protein
MELYFKLPMVFIVMTIDSDASFVQGTWILSS